MKYRLRLFINFFKILRLQVSIVEWHSQDARALQMLPLHRSPRRNRPVREKGLAKLDPQGL